MDLDFATLDLRPGGAEGLHGLLSDSGGTLLAEIGPGRSHRRGWLEGFMVEPFEVAAIDAEGTFLWRLYAARRGLASGFVLSLVATDAQAQGDHPDALWTVGRLGREHLPEPDFGPAAEDRRTLFFRGEPDRVMVDGDEGLWGTLEARRQGLALCRWDGRLLGVIEVEAADQTGQALALRPADARADALEEVALVAAAVVRAAMVWG